MFTTKTMATSAFSNKLDNIKINIADTNTPALALVAAVSRERGLEHWRLYDFSLNADRYMEFLDGVAADHPEGNVAIFMDNLRVHHSKKVTAHLKTLNMAAIFNVPYSPEYNPIEIFWSGIKHNYKKLRL